MPSVFIRHQRLLFLLGSILFLFCTALASYTNNYLFMLPPFALLFAICMVLNWKSMYWLLVFCIPISFNVTILNGRLSTSCPDEQIMWGFLLLFMFIFFGHRNILPNWFLKNAITLVLFLQLIWLIVAVLFSENLFLSFKYLISQLWFAVSFILIPIFIFREKSDFKRAFLLFGIPLVLHTIVVFCWHYTKHFGYYSSNTVVLPFYENHVDYSTVLSMFFPFLLIAYQLSKGNRRYRRILLLFIIFFLPAIYVAGARAAILAVFFSFFINFAIRKKFVKWVMPSIYIVLIVVVTFLVKNNNYYDLRPDMKYTATQASFTETVTAMFSGTDMSSMERFYRWIASVRMSQERPITGVGPNNFYDYYKGYAVTAFKTWVSRNEFKSTTHNYFLLMLVEQGWPGMILYGILIMVMFAQAQKIYHSIKDPFYKKVTMGLVMCLAACFVNNFFSELITTHKIGFLFYTPLVLLIVVKHLSKKQDSESDIGISLKS